ncbi:MAG TPA: hypothetical protein VNG12_10695 [Acidimicrobiales bacterium]|nr:hypothetical protein [Acidimicrobiales bacterium]
MAQSRDLRQQIDHLVESAQHEVLTAGRQLADGITKESERLVPPFTHDIERVVDQVFDFAERVMKGQRKMVNDMVKAINEQSRRAVRQSPVVSHKVTAKTPKKTGPKQAGPRKAVAAKRTTARSGKA